MVSQKIIYENLDGEQCTGTFMFNLSKHDFVLLNLRYRPGIEECYNNLVQSGDIEGAYLLVMDLIVTGYGVREGQSFVKNVVLNGRNSRPDLAGFRHHPACEQLMIDLLSDQNLLLGFFRNLTSIKMTDEEFNKLAESIQNNEEAIATETTDQIRQNGSEIMETNAPMSSESANVGHQATLLVEQPNNPAQAPVNPLIQGS